jgi:hypothetical protein
MSREPLPLTVVLSIARSRIAILDGFLRGSYSSETAQTLLDALLVEVETIYSKRDRTRLDTSLASGDWRIDGTSTIQYFQETPTGIRLMAIDCGEQSDHDPSQKDVR